MKTLLLFILLLITDRLIASAGFAVLERNGTTWRIQSLITIKSEGAILEENGLAQRNLDASALGILYDELSRFVDYDNHAWLDEYLEQFWYGEVEARTLLAFFNDETIETIPLNVALEPFAGGYDFHYAEIYDRLPERLRLFVSFVSALRAPISSLRTTHPLSQDLADKIKARVLAEHQVSIAGPVYSDYMATFPERSRKLRIGDYEQLLKIANETHLKQQQIQRPNLSLISIRKLSYPLIRGAFGIDNDVRDLQESPGFEVSTFLADTIYNEAVNEIAKRSQAMGVDPSIATSILNRIRSIDSKALFPIAVEYAVFEGKNVVRVSLLWEYKYGVGQLYSTSSGLIYVPDSHLFSLGHIRSYLIDVATLEVIHFSTCA